MLYAICYVVNVVYGRCSRDGCSKKPPRQYGEVTDQDCVALTSSLTSYNLRPSCFSYAVKTSVYPTTRREKRTWHISPQGIK